MLCFAVYEGLCRALRVELKIGTLARLLRQAEISAEDFIANILSGPMPPSKSVNLPT